MFTICWVLSGMVIFIGDPFNILASTLCFLITIFITCEGTLWKKITIGTMFASTILSFNALRDNYFVYFFNICALYANALDNAVEACMKLEEDKRIITLKSKAQKGLFCLEVRNPVLNSSENTHENIPSDSAKQDFIKSNLTKSYLIPQTSKSDKANHGFGLKGIKEIAERYHGSLELQSANGIFDLFLYIPLT